MKSITFEGRKKFEKLYAAGSDLRSIAAVLGVQLATVYREAARGNTGELDANGRYGYSAEIAQKDYLKNTSRRGRKRYVVQAVKEDVDHA